MEKDRSTKVIAIIALLVAVVGLSLGFAAFSQQLTITPKADVKADSSKFKVLFSKESSETTSGDVAGVLTLEDGENATAGNANIQETTVTNAEAVFSKDNQTITYTWYVRNDGELDAYLTNVEFTNTQPVCTEKGGSGVTDELMQAACSKVTAKINVHGQEYTSTQAVTSEYKIAAGDNTEIKLVIEAGDGATLVDGDYTATFDAIKLTYSSKSPAGA